MPITLTRIVRTGSRARCRRRRSPRHGRRACSPPSSSVSRAEVEHVALDEPEVRVLAEVRPREGVAMEVVDRERPRSSSTRRRASVVPMNPAPPVTRMRLPVSDTRGSRRPGGPRAPRSATGGSPCVEMRVLLVLGCAAACSRPARRRPRDRRSRSCTARTRAAGGTCAGRFAAGPSGRSAARGGCRELPPRLAAFAPVPRTPRARSSTAARRSRSSAAASTAARLGAPHADRRVPDRRWRRVRRCCRGRRP